MRWEHTLPKMLYTHAHYLNDLIGADEYAWSYQTILHLCNTIQAYDLVILGGDVYEKKTHTIAPTYDSWCYEGDSPQESVRCTLDYIQHYIQRNGSHYLFTLVVRPR